MHQRRSIRLPDYDYAANGAYFVTICTYDKEHLFGEIVDSQMSLNDWGEIVYEEWQKTGEQRPYVELDAFVVMPNHVHGIIVINHDAKEANRRGMARHAQEQTAPQQRQFAKPIPQSLPTIVGAFKSAVTKHINLTREDRSPIWQRNYHEHIIRDHKRYEFIYAYIETNPARWTEDSLYTNR